MSAWAAKGLLAQPSTQWGPAPSTPDSRAPGRTLPVPNSEARLRQPLWQPRGDGVSPGSGLSAGRELRARGSSWGNPEHWVPLLLLPLLLLGSQLLPLFWASCCPPGAAGAGHGAWGLKWLGWRKTTLHSFPKHLTGRPLAGGAVVLSPSVLPFPASPLPFLPDSRHPGLPHGGHRAVAVH